jgi:hypothetical protein
MGDPMWRLYRAAVRGRPRGVAPTLICGQSVASRRRTTRGNGGGNSGKVHRLDRSVRTAGGVTKIPGGIGGGFVERYRYVRGDRQLWRKIDRILGVSGFASRRRIHKDIRRAILWYRGSRGSWDQAPRPAQVAKRLQAVLKAVDALDKALADLTHTERQLMRNADIRTGDRWKHDPSGYRAPISDIRRLAGLAVNRIPGELGGKVADIPFVNLIDRLSITYRRETTREPSAPSDDLDGPATNDFVSFTDAILHLAGDPTRTSGDLAKAVQRALALVRANGT